MNGNSFAVFALIWTLASCLISMPVLAEVEKGPRVDELLVKMPPYDISEVDIIQGEIDPSNPPSGWILKLYGEAEMVDIEVNNNKTISSYPMWTSPTWDVNFRQAISHLADKEKYIKEVLDGYGIVLDTPVLPWLAKWYNPDVPRYPYDPETAKQRLDKAGYTLGPNGIRVYPPWHEKAGEALDPLIFYVRSDSPERLAVAQMFANELQSVGIPVNLLAVPASIIYQKVFIERDYHLYVGGWSLPLRDPEYLYDLYHTNPHSKDLISDQELDYWLKLLKWAPDQTTAETAAKEAQRRIAEIAATIPLWAPVGVKGHKDGWVGMVNENGKGVDNWWTFLNTWPRAMEKPWIIKYGICSNITSLNPLYASWKTDWIILEKVYDTLIRENPHDPSLDLPWIARDWQITTWVDPISLESKTKLVFHLHTNVYWHPRDLPVQMPLTSYDVKFTIEYIKNFTDSWLYEKVKDVHHVETPDENTVIIYENILSYWTLHYIGELPILPKHVWKDILDPHGFMPDPKLTGSGPFILETYVPNDYILFKANRNYFMPYHPRGDINFDKVIDIYDLIIVAAAYGGYDQRADLDGNYIVDIYDLIIVAVDYGNIWMPDP